MLPAKGGHRRSLASQVNEAIRQESDQHHPPPINNHALNLAAGDAVKKSKLMKDALDVTYEVSKLEKYSPKRDTLLEKQKETLTPDTPGFRVLCPTRWTVRADSFKSVGQLRRIARTLKLGEVQVSDPSIKARIIGVEAQFRTFRYLFGVLVGDPILRQTDNLPRKRKVPRRFEDGTAEAEFFTDCKQYYRQQLYEALDLIVNSIKDRFDQPGYKAYKNWRICYSNLSKRKSMKTVFPLLLLSIYVHTFPIPLPTICFSYISESTVVLSK